MKTVMLLTVFGLLTFCESAWANLLEMKKTVEGTLCKKLATDYAKNSSVFTVQSIAQLQICLAETLKAKTTQPAPKNFDIQPPKPSTNQIDPTLPTPPNLPTPPSPIKIR